MDCFTAIVTFFLSVAVSCVLVAACDAFAHWLTRRRSAKRLALTELAAPFVEDLAAEKFPYESRFAVAKRWLGDRYLLARPIKSRDLPALLRPQI